MVAIGVRFRMTVGALEYAVVAGIGVAGGAHAVRIPVIDVEPGVIEGRARPARRVVAQRTRVREPGGDVIRIVRSLILGSVAAIAIGRNCRVVVIDVALRACHRGVRSRQREARVVVVERCRCPSRSAVAHVALLRKIACDVRWIVRLLIIGEVAGNTRSVRQVVARSAMTLAALQATVRPSQWPSRARMIKGRGRPV